MKPESHDLVSVGLGIEPSYQLSGVGDWCESLEAIIYG